MPLNYLFWGKKKNQCTVKVIAIEFESKSKICGDQRHACRNMLARLCLGGKVKAKENARLCWAKMMRSAVPNGEVQLLGVLCDLRPCGHLACGC